MTTLILFTLILYVWIFRHKLTEIQKSSALIAPFIIPLIAAGVSAAAKGISAARQRKIAKRKLKESEFIPPELAMNQNLAQLQAYSRRAPGAGKAEENVRRAQANAISATLRSSGGDTGKIAAASVASQQAANDANDRIAQRGQEFSENAFNRLQNANLGVAGQKRQNRAEYNQAKIQLLQASDQNYMSAFNDLMQGAMSSAYLGSEGDPSAMVGGGYKGRSLYNNSYSDNAFGRLS